MNCRNVKKRLSAYQDGELGLDKQEKIKSHLQGCTECSALYEEFQHTWEALGEVPEIHPSPVFYQELRKEISRLHEHRFTPGLRQVFQLLPARPVTAAIVLTGLVIGIFAGNFLFKQSLISPRVRQPGYSQRDVIIASIRVFDAIPPSTLAHGYVRMASYAGDAR